VKNGYKHDYDDVTLMMCEPAAFFPSQRDLPVGMPFVTFASITQI
jgi:hypothetical protein